MASGRREQVSGAWGWSGRLGLGERAGAPGVELGRRHRGLVLTACRPGEPFLSDGPGQGLGQPVMGRGPVPAGPARIAGLSRVGRRDRVVCWKLLVHSASPLMRQSRGVPLACSGIC